MFKEIEVGSKTYIVTPDAVFVEYDPRCKNCRFWGVEWKWSTDERKICKRLNGNTQEGYGVFAIDGLGSISLATQPDFGCIHFEPVQMPPESPVSDEKE